MDGGFRVLRLKREGRINPLTRDPNCRIMKNLFGPARDEVYQWKSKFTRKAWKRR